MPDRTPRDRHDRRGRPPRAGAPPTLPRGPVAIATGTAELVRDPADPAGVTLLVNGVPSSFVHLDDPERLDFEYMQQMAVLVDALPPGPLDAVHLGAGGCSLPRWLDAVRPGSRQLAVDLDATLLTLVREWFALPRAPRLRLRPGDARTVLEQLPDASADIVVRDVFAGDTTPAELTTLEAAGHVARVLRPGGLYLANCADRPPLALARAELATLAHVLEAGIVTEPALLRGRRYGNLVLVGVAPGGPDLADPATARALRSLAVPARLLHGEAARDFAGGAPVRRDPDAREAAPR